MLLAVIRPLMVVHAYPRHPFITNNSICIDRLARIQETSRPDGLAMKPTNNQPNISKMAKMRTIVGGVNTISKDGSLGSGSHVTRLPFCGSHQTMGTDIGHVSLIRVVITCIDVSVDLFLHKLFLKV